MKKILSSISVACICALSSVAFAQKPPAEQEGGNFPELFLYEQPSLNFFKPTEFKITNASVVDIAYDKYALKDLGINEEQFLKHIDSFKKHSLNFLEDKNVSGPMLISFSLETIKPKEKEVVCEKTPKKCAMNMIEIILNPEYQSLIKPLSAYVIKQLEIDGDKSIDISKDYSEPIVSNFNYIGSMKSFILLNLTPKDKMTAKEEKFLNKIQKTIPDLLYPEGEHNAQKFSDLQQKYWNINKKNSNELNKNIIKNENNEKEIVEEKSTVESETLTDEQKIIMEFNQQRQKLFPLPSQRFNSQNNNKT